MIPRFNFAYLTALFLVVGSGTAALLLMLAPTLPAWGIRHTPHDEPRFLTLTSQQTIDQTFLFEYQRLDTVVLWLDPDSLANPQGLLALTVKTNTDSTTSYLPVANIPPDGIAVFSFQPPVSAPVNQSATMRLTLADTDRSLRLKYQIDASIYPDGDLHATSHPNRVGDIAWQSRYQRPALVSPLIHWLYVIFLPLAGILAASLLIYIYHLPTTIPSLTFSPSPGTKTALLHRLPRPLPRFILVLLPALLTVFVFLFYSSSLILPGTWIGTADFSKELSYVTSSALALRAGAWPVWTHFTCGGMSLLGNPEATTLSISTLLAALTSRPELSLWLTLSIEATLACLGTYLLAKALRLSTPASLLAAAIASLSAVFPYKIVEGIVMIGGPLAFTPWAFLGLYRTLKSASSYWLVLCSLSLIAIFWRGDVHIILLVILIITLWCLASSILQRRPWPLLVLLAILLIFFLGASLKVLPYLEQINLINSQVDPHSAQLTQQKLWSDIFLSVQARTNKIPVLHGLPEHFGYFGAYVGLLPMLLVLLSLFSSNPFRYFGWFFLLVSLLLADGYLYEHWLRFLGPLSSLLRMPSRFLTVSVLFVALLAGLGWDVLRAKLRRFQIPPHPYSPLILALLVGILAWPLYDLTRASYSILQRDLSNRSSTILPPPAVPTLTAHLNSSPADHKHPSILLQSGYLLPHICGDQNNPPEFLSRISDTASLADYPATLEPNQITLYNLPALSSIYIKTRFVSSWQPSAGIVLAAPDESLQLITPPQPISSIRLQYHSATIRSQQVLLLTFITIILVMFVRPVYKIALTALHWRHA